MTATIQDNVEQLLKLFERVPDTVVIRQRMNDEIANLQTQYSGIVFGIFNQYFKNLSISEIVCRYTHEFLSTVRPEHSELIEKMKVLANNIATEIAKLAGTHKK
jgi:hypothetical protein